MRLHGLLPRLHQAPSFARLAEAMRRPGARAVLSAITPGRPYAIAALHGLLGRPMLLVAAR
ncbi:MAG: hypothetical protein M3336_10485, partial [Chloroflexota bacterium]|nr:hypothetical protein [Chloroflexota bacterium]